LRRRQMVGAIAVISFFVLAGPARSASPLSEGAALFVGASSDATHVYFFSVDRLVAADTDSTKDLYESVGGSKRLLAASPALPTGATDASLRGVTFDGSHVFFQTKERLLPEDTDSAVDTYDRSGSGLTLVSTGPQNANGPGAGRFQASSRDGSVVVFSSPDALVPSDADTIIDLYSRVGGVTTLLTPGTSQPPLALGREDRGIYGVPRRRAAVDGSGLHVFFATEEKLDPADLDNQIDIYERLGGTTSFVSTGPADDGTCAGLDCDAELEAVSSDGTRVVFDTRSKLVPEDTDGANDLYSRSSGMTTLVSVGASGQNASFPGMFAASTDATRVLFGSSKKLTADDLDPYSDIFERAEGTTTLISGGQFDRSFAGATGPGVEFLGASADLGRVLFETYEGLLPADRYGDVDIYSREGGRTTIVSGSPLDPNDGNSTVEFGGVSANGRTVYFSTQDRLLRSDLGQNLDIYGRTRKRLFLVSKGQGSRRHGGTQVLAVSPGGGRVVFTSAIPLLRSDHDRLRDLYERHGGRLILRSG